MSETSEMKDREDRFNEIHEACTDVIEELADENVRNLLANNLGLKPELVKTACEILRGYVPAGDGLMEYIDEELM